MIQILLPLSMSLYQCFHVPFCLPSFPQCKLDGHIPKFCDCSLDLMYSVLLSLWFWYLTISLSHINSITITSLSLLLTSHLWFLSFLVLFPISGFQVYLGRPSSHRLHYIFSLSYSKYHRKSDIILCSSFFWFTSLKMLSSISIKVSENHILSSLLAAASSLAYHIFHTTYHIFMMQPSVGYLGWFRILVVVLSDSMHNAVHMFFWINIFFVLEVDFQWWNCWIIKQLNSKLSKSSSDCLPEGVELDNICISSVWEFVCLFFCYYLSIIFIHTVIAT